MTTALATTDDADEARFLGMPEILDAWGRPLYVNSPSSVRTFRECKRKWAHKAIDKRPKADNEYADFGKVVHSQLQHYMDSGTPPDISTPHGLVALPAIKYLPVPMSAHVLAERMFHIMTDAGPFVGLMDLFYVDADGVPLITDYKTTGDFKWAETEASLQEAEQAVVYGAMVVTASEDPALREVLGLQGAVDGVRVRWLYLKRDPEHPKAKPVISHLSLSQIDKHMRSIIETAREMQWLYLARTPALSLPPSPKACEQYGGCPYRDICNLTPQERLRAHMSQDLAAFMATRSQGAPPPGAPPGAPPQGYGPPPPQGAPPTGYAAPPPQGYAPQQPPPGYGAPPQGYAPQQPPPGPPPAPPGAVMARGRKKKDAAAINPPEQAGPMPIHAQPQQAGYAPQHPPAGYPQQPPPGYGPPPPRHPGYGQAGPTAGYAQPPAPGYGPPPHEYPPQPQAYAAPPQPQQAGYAPQAPAYAAIPRGGFTLVVDASPSKVNGSRVIFLEELVGVVAAGLAQAYNVQNYRQISTEFAVAQGALMGAVAQQLDAAPFGPEVIVVADTASLVTRDCLELFLHRAATVIRGNG